VIGSGFSTPDFLFHIVFLSQTTGAVQKIENRHAADYEIAQKAEQIGEISEQAEADDGRENDLRVVIDRDLPGRSEAVGRGDGKLASGSAQTGGDQDENLLRCHGAEVKQDFGQNGQAGEGGKEKDDETAPLSPLTQQADQRIGNAGANTAGQTDESGNQVQIAEGGLDDTQRAGKSAQQAEALNRGELFLQDKETGDHREKRRELVEHGGVGQQQMVHGVEIGQDTDGTEAGPPQQNRPVFGAGGSEGLAVFYNDSRGNEQGNEIAEKTLLHGGDVPGQPDEDIHARKAESGGYDKQNAFIFWIDFHGRHSGKMRFDTKKEHRKSDAPLGAGVHNGLD